MTFDLTVRQRKILALGVLLAAMGVLYGLIINPLLTRYLENEERIAFLEKRYVSYQGIAENTPRLQAVLNTKLREAKQAQYFLRSEKHALASAELQELVRNVINVGKGRLISSQAHEVNILNNRKIATVDARLQGDIVTLRNVLQHLANSRPLVFVDELMVTSMRGRKVGFLNDGQSNKAQLLDIRIKVRAYLQPSAAGV